jgi:hypothetical protein
MIDKILSDPTSVAAWVVLLFLLIKDVYFWIKNKGIPKFEDASKKIDITNTKIEKIDSEMACFLRKLEYIETSLKSSRRKSDDILKQLGESEEIIEKLASLVNDLYSWHNVTTEEGVKLWYIRPSLERALESLKSAIDVQTSLTRELVMEIKNNSNTLYRMEEKIN